MPDRPMAVVKILICDFVDGHEPGEAHEITGIGVEVGIGWGTKVTVALGVAADESTAVGWGVLVSAALGVAVAAGLAG